MGLLIHNNKLYYDYGLIKIKIDTTDKEFVVYHHDNVINILSSIVLLNTILYLLFILIDLGLLLLIINTISVFICYCVVTKYINDIIYIYLKIINNVCILKPTISYHIKNNYDNDYYIYQLYDGLSFKKYNKKCKLEIKDELDKYNIKEITNIISEYL